MLMGFIFCKFEVYHTQSCSQAPLSSPQGLAAAGMVRLGFGRAGELFPSVLHTFHFSGQRSSCTGTGGAPWPLTRTWAAAGSVSALSFPVLHP